MMAGKTLEGSLIAFTMNEELERCLYAWLLPKLPYNSTPFRFSRIHVDLNVQEANKSSCRILLGN